MGCNPMRASRGRKRRVKRVEFGRFRELLRVGWLVFSAPEWIDVSLCAFPRYRRINLKFEQQK